jgi:hypothetical protein
MGSPGGQNVTLHIREWIMLGGLVTGVLGAVCVFGVWLGLRLASQGSSIEALSDYSRLAFIGFLLLLFISWVKIANMKTSIDLNETREV